MPINLEEIKARYEAATPGEWVESFSATHGPCIKVYLGPNQQRGITVAGELEVNDLEFIVHAHQDIPALIAEVERLRTALEE